MGLHIYVSQAVAGSESQEWTHRFWREALARMRFVLKVFWEGWIGRAVVSVVGARKLRGYTPWLMIRESVLNVGDKGKIRLADVAALYS